MSRSLAAQPRNATPRNKAGKFVAAARQKKLDKEPGSLVDSRQLLATPPAATETAPAPPSASVQEKKMDLTFTRSKAARKDDRLVIFNFADGRPGSVQFLRTAFPEQVPETITMSGDFAEKTERVAKAKETPEERKARLANLPKLTLAEKVAKAEERAAKLRAKLAKTVDAGAQASM